MADRPSPRVILTDPVHLLAFGGGAGLAPKAPGTFGTLVAIPLELALRGIGFWPRVAVIAALLVAGIWICGESARRLRTHDHPGIVFDEIVGFLIAMLAAPAGWGWIIAGFVLFRLFDIVKPWPIRELDHSIHGGAGIMLDDVVAGLFAAASLLGARWLLPVFS